MFIRQALEGEAMREVAPRSDDRLMARLDESLHRQKLAVEQTDGTRFFEHDLAFHEILLSTLGYERVKAVVEAARGSLDRTRLFLLRTPERQAESYLEHRAIVDALRTRDPDAAQRAMKHHLDKSMEEIERRAAENPEIFTPGPGAELSGATRSARVARSGRGHQFSVGRLRSLCFPRRLCDMMALSAPGALASCRRAREVCAPRQRYCR